MKLSPLALLVFANAGIAAALVFLWQDSARTTWVEPAVVAPSLDTGLPAVQPAAAEIARYRETLERPLFVATRRPAPQQSAQGDKPQDADPAKDLRLLGLYELGNRGGAIVEHGGKIQRVPFGQKVGGWTVAGAVGQRASIVRGNGEKRELQVALANTPASAAAAAASAEAPAGAGQSSVASGVQRSAAGRDSRRQLNPGEAYRRRAEELKARRAGAGSSGRNAATNVTPEKAQ